MGSDQVRLRMSVVTESGEALYPNDFIGLAVRSVRQTMTPVIFQTHFPVQTLCLWTLINSDSHAFLVVEFCRIVCLICLSDHDKSSLPV